MTDGRMRGGESALHLSSYSKMVLTIPLQWKNRHRPFYLTVKFDSDSSGNTLFGAIPLLWGAMTIESRRKSRFYLDFDLMVLIVNF